MAERPIPVGGIGTTEVVTPTVTVNPLPGNILYAPASHQFTGTVNWNGAPAGTSSWLQTAGPGAISGAGYYSCGAIGAATTVQIRHVATNGNGDTGTWAYTFTAAPMPDLLPPTVTINNGIEQLESPGVYHFDSTVNFGAGSGTAVWSIIAGPAGATIDAATGEYTTPAVDVDTPATIRLTADKTSNSTQAVAEESFLVMNSYVMPPLPDSGALSFQDLQNQFGGDKPLGLDEYYSGGLGPQGVPASGPISVGDFHGNRREAKEPEVSTFDD